MARLILQTAEGQQAIDLRPVNSLGRHPNNSIQLLDKIVSKEHCIIEQRGDQWILRDLGSLNGTFINNERVRGEAALKHGDEIALGATRGRFDDGAIPAPAAAPPQAPPWAPTPSHASPLASSAHGMPQPPYPTPAAPPVGAQQPVATYQPYERQPLGAAGPPPMPHGQIPQPPSTYPHGAPPYPAASHGLQPPHIGPGGTAPMAPSGRQAHYVAHGTRIDLNDQARHIGTQIAAIDKGFQPFERISSDLNQLRADYERLRLSHELSREIAAERDTDKLLEKILASVFKFILADRGVIFLRDESGELAPRASQRRDGTNAPISISQTILNHVVNERAAVLTHDAAMDFANSKGKSMILNRISSAMVAPLLHNNEVLGVLWLDSENLAQFQPKDLELITAIANQAAMFIEISILGKKVENEILMRDRFSRLLSPNIAERVMSGQLEVKLGGERVEQCTVFNSDIRGFTAMSEKASPESIVEMLNEYFEEMVDTIFKYEGTLDKFMGDGIMGMWGAPVSHPDDAIRSVSCALEMNERLKELNVRRIAKAQPELKVGIGIHTGPLVAGYIGSSKALSYTVIGDTANTSARICSIAKASQIVITEATYERLGGKFVVEELEPARVKGISKPLRVFNVTGVRPAASVPDAVFASEPTTSS